MSEMKRKLRDGRVLGKEVNEKKVNSTITEYYLEGRFLRRQKYKEMNVTERKQRKYGATINMGMDELFWYPGYERYSRKTKE